MSRSRAAVVWKTALELRIRLGELAFAAAQGVEGDGAVAEQLLDREPLRVEQAEDALSNSEKNGSSSARALEKRLAAAGDRDRRLPASIPGRRRGCAGRRCGRSRRAGPIRRRWPWPACRRRAAWARRRCRASVRRRSRRAGSWCAGSPACPCGIGAYWSSMSIVACACWPSGDSSMFCTLPTETPEIRTSDCWASWVASLKGTLIS